MFQRERKTLHDLDSFSQCAETLETYRAALTALDAATVAAEHAHRCWLEQLQALAEEVAPSSSLKAELLTGLYWQVLELNTKQIGDLFGLKQGQVSAAAGAFDSGIQCTRCNQSILARSRSHLHDLQTAREEGSIQLQVNGRVRQGQHSERYNEERLYEGVLCLACIEVMQTRWKEDIEQKVRVELEARQRVGEPPPKPKKTRGAWRRHSNDASASGQVEVPSPARIQELRAMPYSEYLRSPEWDQTRKRQYQLAGYRCKVCNASNRILHVHHRTYERLGCETDADLVVLCDECHKLYHDHEKA